MTKGGERVLIGFFVLSGFFYCFISVRSAFRAVPAQATSTPPVVINEIAWMGGVTNENQEWIELKNNSSESIDLRDWKLKSLDGTPDIKLEGVIEPEGYFLLERTSELTVPNVTSSQIYAGALGNGGEELALYDASSVMIDLIMASSSWPAGNNSTKQTMERDDAGWHTSELPGGTPKAANSVPSSTEAIPVVTESTSTATTTRSAAVTDQQDFVSQPTTYSAPTASDPEVVITEILPSPRGSDLIGEFIELFNGGTAAVDLAGWKVVVGERKFIISATSTGGSFIPPNGYKTLWRTETKLVLPNDQGQVQLYSPERIAPRQIVSYEKAPEGKSYAENELSEWRWTQQPTPGLPNIIKADNQPPEVDWSVKTGIETEEAVLFDSSDTTDHEDDKLQFSWSFGDEASSSEPNPMHSFSKPGRYKVELTVSDGQSKASKARTLSVTQKKPTSTPMIVPASKEPVRMIAISEFLPNPIGEDADGEWIELYNADVKEASLFGWQLDDSAAGSHPYEFGEDAIIKPLSYYLVDREDSNIALNNGSDEVRLLSLGGSLVEAVSYSGAKEGQSYAKDAKGQWHWAAPTPGKANRIVPTAITANARSAGKASSKIAKASSKKSSTSAIMGTVTSLPRQIGKQIFYIVGDGSWQVYNYRRDFPKLRLGDQLEIMGQTDVVKGERRIKTSKLADIKVLRGGAVPVPDELTCDQLGNAQLSRLVKISGELTKKTATSWYVDDGSGEVAVYVTKPIAANFSKTEEGVRLAVAGIVTPTASGVRLVPRTSADIIPAGDEAADDDFVETSDAIPARDTAIELRRYAELIGLGAILAALGWWLRKRYSI